jgi:hypothetical protein
LMPRVTPQDTPCDCEAYPVESLPLCHHKHSPEAPPAAGNACACRHDLVTCKAAMQHNSVTKRHHWLVLQLLMTL